MFIVFFVTTRKTHTANNNMLAGGPSMAIASMWASMADWSTPTILFCVLNLTIVTIFITSNFKTHNHHHHNNNNMPSQLTRSPSLLERVKSINLSSFYSTQESHDDQYNRVHSATIESEQLSDSPSELTRAPSLLDRVKSFKLVSSFKSGETSSSEDNGYSDIDSHDHDLVEDHNVTSDNLSEKPGVTRLKRSVSNLMKSGSEKRVAPTSDGGEEDVNQRRPATMKHAVQVSDESVDAKADDFIKRFKQQLKLQRIDSLERWRKMFGRETSST